MSICRRRGICLGGGISKGASRGPRIRRWLWNIGIGRYLPRWRETPWLEAKWILGNTRAWIGTIRYLIRCKQLLGGNRLCFRVRILCWRFPSFKKMVRLIKESKRDLPFRDSLKKQTQSLKIKKYSNKMIPSNINNSNLIKTKQSCSRYRVSANYSLKHRKLKERKRSFSLKQWINWVKTSRKSSETQAKCRESEAR